MFSGLSDIKKAGIFTALVLVMATAAALVIRALHMPAGPVTAAIYMFVPAVATLIMLLVITKDGYSKAGWKSLGLHRAGYRVWGVALLAPLLVGVVGTAIVWATPLATFVAPPPVGGVLIALLVQVVVYTVTYSLGEELGWRGYLLPRLIHLGRDRALVLVGLVWAAWHLPMILLTPLYHSRRQQVDRTSAVRRDDRRRKLRLRLSTIADRECLARGHRTHRPQCQLGNTGPVHRDHQPRGGRRVSRWRQRNPHSRGHSAGGGLASMEMVWPRRANSPRRRRLSGTEPA